MAWTFTLVDSIGAVGMAGIFIAFTLNELDVIDDNTVSFNLLNVGGASILWWYSLQIQSPIFLILNTFWVLVAAGKLIKLRMSIAQ